MQIKRMLSSWEERLGSLFQRKTDPYHADSMLFSPGRVMTCNGLNLLCCEYCEHFTLTTFYIPRPTTDENILRCQSLEEALNALQSPPISNQLENIWIIGGASVYQVTK